MTFANKFGLFALFNLLLIQVNIATAFYESEDESSYIDARALLRGYFNYNEYPNDDILYPENTSDGFAGIARLIIEGGFSNSWSYDINIYQTYIPNRLANSQNQSAYRLGVERSSLLEKSLTNNAYAQLVLDQFSLRWSGKSTDVTLGRQAINLATNFYFTPNDFFAPFAAQTFFRVYKPGVDAIRYEQSLAEFSQLSLIVVAGYQRDQESDNGWSKTPDSSRASYLAVYSGVYGNAEYGFIGGAVSDKNIIGGNLQGEWFKWLGYRMEGHYAIPDNNQLNNYTQLSMGLEHRWENTLTLRLELFHNGQGKNSIDDYSPGLQANNSASLVNESYLTKKYAAIGANYELTPLLIGDVVLIRNLDDQSSLLSLNAVYSLSNESELAFSFNLPLGDEPNQGVPRSEFGSYPQTFNLEFRQYW